MGEQARALMVQGTMSHAGKSMLVAALCRIFAQDGLRVAPFKSQNMSNNSYATPDGGEIGRAQAMQAEAAMALPVVEMNPILLKPEGERRSQVVVMGKPVSSATAREYYDMKTRLWPVVTEALDRLRSNADVVVIEGAGSPAEINLRAHEIVNMRVARYAGAPVLLVGDIDRGGVFASLVGTMELLETEERALVKGFVINKFRGDKSLLDPGLAMLRDRTGVATLGVLPYFTGIHLPEEDSLGLPDDHPPAAATVLDIAIARLPRIANFDDFDPLRREPGVRVRWVEALNGLGTPDLMIIPGSKSTVGDLGWLRDSGLAGGIIALRQRGTPVIGVCAGFQMLGRRILDREGVESHRTEVNGLGLLPATTVFSQRKETTQTEICVARASGLLAGCEGMTARGYEIHMGQTDGAPGAPFTLSRRSGRAVQGTDGAMDAEGKVLGTYLHGLFHNDALRLALLRRLAVWKGVSLPKSDVRVDTSKELDKLAAFVRAHLDMDAVYRISGLEPVRR